MAAYSRLPVWILATCAASIAALAGVGSYCFFAPEILFGPDGYRTLARLPIGLVGSGCFGLALSLGLSLRDGSIAAVRTNVRTLLFIVALVPPVLTFNFGALDRVKIALGISALTIVGAFLVLVVLPILLAYLALRHR